MRIFVVEDHHESRVFVVKYLEMRGHEVVAAGSKAEALDLWPAANCRVLLADIRLPDGDGSELLTALSNIEYAVAVSVVCCSGHDGRLMEAGFRRCLRKPFLLTELDDALAAAAGVLAG